MLIRGWGLSQGTTKSLRSNRVIEAGLAGSTRTVSSIARNRFWFLATCQELEGIENWWSCLLSHRYLSLKHRNVERFIGTEWIWEGLVSRHWEDTCLIVTWEIREGPILESVLIFLHFLSQLVWSLIAFWWCWDLAQTRCARSHAHIGLMPTGLTPLGFVWNFLYSKLPNDFLFFNLWLAEEWTKALRFDETPLLMFFTG